MTERSHLLCMPRLLRTVCNLRFSATVDNLLNMGCSNSKSTTESCAPAEERERAQFHVGFT